MNILVLGGSEFMGRTFIQDLLKDETNKVFMINRGKSYWNETPKENSKVLHYYGNRSEYIEFEKLVNYVSEKHGIGEDDNKWDLVVDFSCFERKEIKSVIRALKNKCKLYVFISSDSIYDVCDKKLRRDDFIKEEYAVRPDNDKLIEELNDDEEYGNDKLKCEEYLKSHVKSSDFKYICLRLPDVIGPYDTSGRFWAYMMWIKSCEEYPIHVNKYFQLRYLSFVFSKDVSRLLLSIRDRIYKDDENTNKWLDSVDGESFNVCFEEHLTLKELVERMAEFMGVKSLNFIDERDLIKAGKFFYPSVECGPLSNAKAKKYLHFTSTNINEAIQETIVFFNTAEGYTAELKKAKTKLSKACEVNKI